MKVSFIYSNGENQEYTVGNMPLSNQDFVYLDQEAYSSFEDSTGETVVSENKYSRIIQLLPENDFEENLIDSIANSSMDNEVTEKDFDIVNNSVFEIQKRLEDSKNKEVFIDILNFLIDTKQMVFANAMELANTVKIVKFSKRTMEEDKIKFFLKEILLNSDWDEIKKYEDIFDFSIDSNKIKKFDFESNKKEKIADILTEDNVFNDGFLNIISDNEIFSDLENSKIIDFIDFKQTIKNFEDNINFNEEFYFDIVENNNGSFIIHNFQEAGEIPLEHIEEFEAKKEIKPFKSKRNML